MKPELRTTTKIQGRMGKVGNETGEYVHFWSLEVILEERKYESCGNCPIFEPWFFGGVIFTSKLKN